MTLNGGFGDGTISYLFKRLENCHHANFRAFNRKWTIQAHICATKLCPPLQFGPLTYQPIEWGFISSNQSALWSCLLHVTFQLGEGCSMSFVRFSVLMVWKTCIRNSTVLERFPWWVFRGFYRSLKFVRNFPRSTHIFICWRARKPGTRLKAQSGSSKKDSSNKNVRWLWGGGTSELSYRIFELLR